MVDCDGKYGAKKWTPAAGLRPRGPPLGSGRPTIGRSLSILYVSPQFPFRRFSLVDGTQWLAVIFWRRWIPPVKIGWDTGAWNFPNAFPCLKTFGQLRHVAGRVGLIPVKKDGRFVVELEYLWVGETGHLPQRDLLKNFTSGGGIGWPRIDELFLNSPGGNVPSLAHRKTLSRCDLDVVVTPPLIVLKCKGDVISVG